MPLYKTLWDLVWSTSSTLQESWPVQKVYPIVAPLADPLYSNIKGSKYLKQLETHLKPL